MLALLAAGFALRLSILQAYEPSFDLGVNLNWARRLATAESLGPVGELARGLVAGRIGEVRQLLAGDQDTFLFAVASGLFVYPIALTRFGSTLLVAGWFRAFGVSLEAARLLTILVDVAGLALLALLVLRLTRSRRAALVSLAVLAFLPAKILFSVQVYYHVFGSAAVLIALRAFAASPAFAPTPAPGRRPWRGVAGPGLLLGASMYLDYFQTQLAWLAAGAYAVWAGRESGQLRETLLRFVALTVVVGLVTLPILAISVFGYLALDWNPTAGFGAVADQLSDPGSVPRGQALLGYARNLDEYFTAPVLAAALLGFAALWHGRQTRGAAALVTSFAVVHFAFFALATSMGATLIRAFQALELPVAIAAGCGVARAAALVASTRTAWTPAVTAALALLVASPSLASLPALRSGGPGLRTRLPHFHSEYHRGSEIRDLCGRLGELAPPGSNVFANTWQVLEAVCPELDHLRLVNFKGVCHRPDADAQRAYLRTYFPGFRPEQPSFVVLEERYGPPISEQARCVGTLMDLLGATRAVPVLEGSDSASPFLHRVVRLEGEP